MLQMSFGLGLMRLAVTAGGLMVGIQLAFAAPPTIGDDWYLTFESEFDRAEGQDLDKDLGIETFDQLDPDSDNAKWEFRVGPIKGSYAIEENAFLKEDDGNSVLVLRTSVDQEDLKAGKNAMRTGYIRTRNYKHEDLREAVQFEQTYGYFEARAKIDTTSGQWFAFWLMPQNEIWCADGSARDAAEIDIVEGFPNPAGRSHGREKTVNFAVHYDGYGNVFHKKRDFTFPSSEQKREFGDFDATEFHTYGFLWTPESYTWFVDGVAVFHIDDPDLISQSPKYLKLSTEVDGWVGKIDPRKFPADSIVDWVRVWQTESFSEGNPFEFRIENNDEVLLSEHVRKEKKSPRTWCYGQFAFVDPGQTGRIRIPISQPVDAREVAVRVTNPTDESSAVSLYVDGELRRTWDPIDLDQLFILKLSEDIRIERDIELVWTGDIGISRFYIIPQEARFPSSFN